MIIVRNDNILTMFKGKGANNTKTIQLNIRDNVLVVIKSKKNLQEGDIKKIIETLKTIEKEIKDSNKSTNKPKIEIILAIIGIILTFLFGVFSLL